MNKFLKLIGFFAITAMLMATIGYLMVPAKVVAYVDNGQEVFINPFMIYIFAIINLIISGLSISYLSRAKRKFENEEYPMGIRVVAFITLTLSLFLNYMTYQVVITFLNKCGIEIPMVVNRIAFSVIAILTALYGFYLRKASKENEFSIRNKWTMHNDIVFMYANKFSGIVFIAGAIFLAVTTWTLTNFRQLYITTTAVFLMCGVSALYISRMTYKKFKVMYKETSEKIKNKK